MCMYICMLIGWLVALAVLVDGTVYGPFRRIVIRSCQVGVGSSEQAMMTIPILTNM